MTLTLGVAIDIAEPARSVIRQTRRAALDPLADIIPPHITLQGPTSIATDALAQVMEHLRSVATRHAPFELHLCGTGTFRPITDVVFLQLDRGKSECRKLQSDVCCGILDRKLDYDYYPHVTLAHGVDYVHLDQAFLKLSDYSFHQVITKLSLYQRIGNDWKILQTFDLTGERG